MGGGVGLEVGMTDKGGDFGLEWGHMQHHFCTLPVLGMKGHALLSSSATSDL